MCKNLFKSIAIITLIIVFSCAKRGSITGGSKDTLAPVMIQSLPKNFSTNFNGKSVKLKFNEYVKLKDVNKQLIVSPPMKNQLEILPQLATKELTSRESCASRRGSASPSKCQPASISRAPSSRLAEP